MYNETSKFDLRVYLDLIYTVIVVDVYVIVHISLIIHYTTKLLVYIAIFKNFG